MSPPRRKSPPAAGYASPPMMGESVGAPKPNSGRSWVAPQFVLGVYVVCVSGYVQCVLCFVTMTTTPLWSWYLVVLFLVASFIDVRVLWYSSQLFSLCAWRVYGVLHRFCFAPQL